jgi:hypothetical protein
MRPLVAVLLVAAPLAAADLVHSADSGSFKAKFPAPPRLDEKDLVIGGGRSAWVATHRATDPKSGAEFSVTVADYPAAFAEVPPQTLLDGVRDGLKGKDGKVVAERPLDGPLPGWAVRIEAGQNTIRTRLVLVGSRLFQVTVVAKTNKFPDKLSEEFYASFEPKR